MTAHPDAAPAPPDHPCSDGEGGYDHDWKWISDWYGDAGVINGTADCSHYECKRCGAEDNESEPPSMEDDYEPH